MKLKELQDLCEKDPNIDVEHSGHVLEEQNVLLEGPSLCLWLS